MIKEPAFAIMPIGPRVEAFPAKRPVRTTIEGRLVTLMPLDPQNHGEALYEATQGEAGDRLWLYLFDGPFTSRAVFEAYLQRAAASEDPLFFAIVDRTLEIALGYAAYMRIEPVHRRRQAGREADERDGEDEEGRYSISLNE